MKKFILSIITSLLLISGYAQKSVSLLQVTDTLQTFKKASIPANSIIFDKTENRLWKLTAKAIGTDNLSTSSKILLAQPNTDGLTNTLSIEDKTGANNIVISDGQVIKAENGGGQLNLRVGANSIIDWTNDNGLYLESWFYGDLTTSQFGHLTTCFKVTDGLFQASTNFNNNTDLERITGNSSGLFWELQEGTGATKVGTMGIYRNTLLDFTSADKINYPAILVSQNTTSKIGVVNSLSLGGDNIIIKTNNTAYSNQLGFNSGEGFETILDYTTATANNTQTLQDKTGTIADLSDLFYNVDGALSSNRIVSQTDKNLSFTETTGQFRVLKGTSSPFVVTSSSFYNETNNTTPPLSDVFGSSVANLLQDITSSDATSKLTAATFTTGWIQTTAGVTLSKSNALKGVDIEITMPIGGTSLSGLGCLSGFTIGASASIGTATGYSTFIKTSNLGSYTSFRGYHIQNMSGVTGVPSASLRYGLYLEDNGNNYIAGQVGIGTPTAVASAKLEIVSTTQGFLPPRMTTGQRDAIVTPVDGLIIYNISVGLLQYYDGFIGSWFNV